MRIFLVSNMYPSQTDKMYGVFVKNMHEELIRQQVAFPYKALIEGKAQSRLGKIKKYIRHYIRISSFFFKKDYDLLYVHYFSFHAPILWLLLPFKKKPWVINVHGTDIEKDLAQSPRLNRLASKVLKKTDLLVVPSPNFEEKTRRMYPFLQPEKIYISPSGGLDLSVFHPKKEFKVNKIITLGFVSRFDKAKGWETFLSALKILKQENIAFSAIIIGKGPDKKNIEKTLQRYQLRKEVNLVGFISQEKLPAYFHQMDLYIFPSHRESLGLTGIEAMACGIPIIASDIPGIRSYTTHNENGLLFETKNEKDLADKIEMYLSMPMEQKEAIKHNALQTAKDYEQSVVAKKLKKRLLKLTH